MIYSKYIKQEWKIDNEYELIKLGNICKFNENIKKHPTEYGKISGKYRFHTGTENTKLYINDPDIDFPVIIINRTNGSGRCNIFFDTKCSVAIQTIVFYSKSFEMTKYIYYYFYGNKSILEQHYIGGNHKNISIESIQNIEIPIPSIEKQKEIVESIDNFMVRANIAKQMLEKHEKIMMYEVKKMYQYNKCKMMKLKDVGEFLNKSKRKASYGLDEGKFRFYICSNDKIKWCNESDYNIECIIFGSGGLPVINIDSKFSCSTDNHIFTTYNNDNLNVYIYYFLKLNIEILENGFVGTTIKHISKEYLNNIEIPFPPLIVQQQLKSDFEYLNLTKNKIKEWEYKGNELIQQLSKK